MEINPIPAKTYPYKLDPFQRKSIDCLERKESVLVSAHTSAGKTAIAEYAIAMSLRDHQRVVYTSPIKALSNQKYRDLEQEFSDVGLMTGDVTINPNATVLVMTTEILRSMLYKGSDILREVAWVIYDEIHYMRDKERGVVWEESIILLPDSVRFVFLSATIPNARDFASWIAKIHNQKVNVVYTEYRPVPLQHYLFPVGGDGLFLVIDDKGNFREQNFSKALAGLGMNTLEMQVNEDKKKRPKKPTEDLQRIVTLVMERNLDPVIVFSFSKKDCENYALQMAKMDFTSADEKKLIADVRLEGGFHVDLQERDLLAEQRRSQPSAGEERAAAVGARRGNSPRRSAAHHQGDHRDSLPGGTAEDPFRDGDLRHGHQHACEDVHFHVAAEVRRLGVPHDYIRRVHSDVRPRGPSQQGREGNRHPDRGRGQPERWHQTHPHRQGGPVVQLVPSRVGESHSCDVATTCC